MELELVITRVRNEFIEMPGLRLSVPQAMRLWGLQQAECQQVIDALVHASFLRKTPRGEVIRVPE